MLDSGTLRTQDFFLYATNRQNHTGQGHFTGHGQTILDRAVGQQADERRNHCGACRGAILRHRAGRHVDVYVGLAEKVRVDAVAFGVGTSPGQSSGHGFLHDFAQMAGHGELLATTHAAGFDEDDVAAHGSPDEADGDAGLLDALLDFLLRAELRHTQEFAHHLRRDHHLVGLALGDTASLLTDEGGYFAFEIAHTRLARIAVDDLPQPLLREFELFAFLHAVFFGLLRDQVLARDVDLLFASVAGEFDDLHAIAQRIRDGIHPVGGGDEDDLGKVEGHVEIVIAEGIVLLRIENLHERGRRIAAEVAAQLVDLIEHAHGVICLGALQALNDLAGQRANIGAAMAANFGFVVHAAQGDADELAAEGARNGFAEGGLADARRPDEAKDRPLHAWLEFLDGQVVEDALLHLIQVVVVLVQDFVRFHDVDFRAAGRLGPGQGGHPFEIGARAHIFGGSGGHFGEAFELAVALLLGFRGHAGFFHFRAQLFDFGLRVVDVAEFLLNGLHLLAQQVFALVLADLFLNLLVDLAAEFED